MANVLRHPCSAFDKTGVQYAAIQEHAKQPYSRQHIPIPRLIVHTSAPDAEAVSESRRCRWVAFPIAESALRSLVFAR